MYEDYTLIDPGEISDTDEPDVVVDGRGMRFTKRAVRGDLHRFKAFAEMEEEAEGGWRGTIEDGEVKRKSDRKSPRSQSNHRSGARSRRGRNGSDPHRSSSRSGSRN
jgi:hypothetical protein